MSKYEFTGDTITVAGRILKRIRAVVSFGDVVAGEIGGWIEGEANLQVSGEAWVYGNARVYDNARVSGDAQVYGNARVYDNARVSGDAQVSGNAQVSGEAWVYGNAWVYGDARVSGDAQVSGNAWVSGNAQVSGEAWVYGNARVYDNARVSDNAWVQIGPIGSRRASLTATLDATIGVRVTTGCFSGSLADFESAVQATHGDNEHGQHYRLAIALIKAKLGGGV